MKNTNTTLILFLLLTITFSVFLWGPISGWNWGSIQGIGTFIATFLMSLFAWLTYSSAKKSAEKQQQLLEHQNKIQKNQYLLYKAEKLNELLDLVQDIIDKITNPKTDYDSVNFDLLFVDAKTQLFYPGNTAVKKLTEIIDGIQNKKKSLHDTQEPLSQLHSAIEDDLEKIGIELKKLEV